MAVRARVRDSKGFSLIELMIAIVIIMISMLALLSITLTSINANIQNDLRNTAVRLTNQTAEVLLTLPMEPVIDPGLTDGSHSRASGDAAQNEKGFPPREQTVRGARRTYSIAWNVISQTDSVKEITITVGYMYKNRPYSNTSVIYKHKSI